MFRSLGRDLISRAKLTVSSELTFVLIMTFLFLLISFVVGIIASKATVEEKYISASFLFYLYVFRRQLRPLVIVPAFLVLEGCRDLLGLVACQALLALPDRLALLELPLVVL